MSGDVLGSAGKGAAYGSVVGPIGTVAGAVGGALYGAFGSGQDGGPGYAPQHGGFSGPGYGQPGSPGFDQNGLALPNGNPNPDMRPLDSTGQPGQPGQGGMGVGGDPRVNAFSWRGDPNAAANDAARYQGMGANWGNIQSPGNDYGQANWYGRMGESARGSQNDAVEMQRQAALGNAPSQAAIQMRQGNDQAMANSLSLAAGARGPAAMAGAQQQAIGSNSAMATNNINNMGALRANEMSNARGAYGQMATGMRGQDAQFMGQAAQMAQANGQMGLGYRQLGLQGQQAFEGMGFNVNQAQMGGQMGLYGANDANFNAQQQRNNQSQANANQNIATGVQAWGNLVSTAKAAGG